MLIKGGVIKRLWCLLGWHAWTCKAEQGIKPTEEEIRDPIAGFASYSKMYCKNCEKVSDLCL